MALSKYVFDAFYLEGYVEESLHYSHFRCRNWNEAKSSWWTFIKLLATSFQTQRINWPTENTWRNQAKVSRNQSALDMSLIHLLIAAPKDIPDIAVDGKELWDMMMNETERVDPIVMNAIHRLKGITGPGYYLSALNLIQKTIDSGRFITAALTNNSETAQDQNKTSDSLRKVFDHFIESKVVGLR